MNERQDIFPRLAEKAERIVQEQFLKYKTAINSETNQALIKFKQESIVYHESLTQLFQKNKELQERLLKDQIELLNKLVIESQQKSEKNIEDSTKNISDLIYIQKTRFLKEYTEIKNNILEEIDKKVKVLEKLNDRLIEKLEEQRDRLHERIDEVLIEFIGRNSWHILFIILIS